MGMEMQEAYTYIHLWNFCTRSVHELGVCLCVCVCIRGFGLVGMAVEEARNDVTLCMMM
jgi:hypothetical protein